MSDDAELTNGGRVVVAITTVHQHEHVRSERYVAQSIGAALDAHAPDPAPGARFEIEVVGRAQNVENAPSPSGAASAYQRPLTDFKDPS